MAQIAAPMTPHPSTNWPPCFDTSASRLNGRDCVSNQPRATRGMPLFSIPHNARWVGGFAFPVCQIPRQASLAQMNPRATRGTWMRIVSSRISLLASASVFSRIIRVKAHCISMVWGYRCAAPNVMCCCLCSPLPRVQPTVGAISGSDTPLSPT